MLLFYATLNSIFLGIGVGSACLIAARARAGARWGSFPRRPDPRTQDLWAFFHQVCISLWGAQSDHCVSPPPSSRTHFTIRTPTRKLDIV